MSTTHDHTAATVREYHAAMTVTDSADWDVFTRETFEAATAAVACADCADSETEQREWAERESPEHVATYRAKEAEAKRETDEWVDSFAAFFAQEADAGTPGTARRAKAAAAREDVNYQDNWEFWCA